MWMLWKVFVGAMQASLTFCRVRLLVLKCASNAVLAASGLRFVCVGLQCCRAKCGMFRMDWGAEASCGKCWPDGVHPLVDVTGVINDVVGCALIVLQPAFGLFDFSRGNAAVSIVACLGAYLGATEKILMLSCGIWWPESCNQQPSSYCDA